ncbi:hypothetical protein CULT_2420002 [[Clostridium] ultunense Esp]|nr:hypothetical protein CULT_2420002 [[Clostridium] ultunense Esp]
MIEILDVKGKEYAVYVVRDHDRFVKKAGFASKGSEPAFCFFKIRQGGDKD